MRTPERGQLEAFTIGCQKPPRGFSRQLRHSVTCPRLDLLYQSESHRARGELKKLLGSHSWPSQVTQFSRCGSRSGISCRNRQPSFGLHRRPMRAYNFNMISVVQLGPLNYSEGLRLQRKLVDLRKAGEIGDILLLLEHSPVITLGRNAKAANVLASADALAGRGVEVFECDRGGDVTFHGPGQLVGYPIFDLRGYSSSQFSALSSQFDSPRRKTLGAVDYVRRLEDVLIRTCGDFSIAAKRIAGLTGAWAERDGVVPGLRRDCGSETRNHTTAGAGAEAKIAAIGVHISRSVTSHGFALNVNTDLGYFNLIVPCGIAARPVTSMQTELGRAIDLNEVAQAVARNFGTAFGSQILWVDTVDALLGNVVGVPMKPPDELRRLRGEADLFVG
jgi:lipoyl(octanoyl) transferase